MHLRPVCLLLSLLLVSCGDDPALVKKRQEQKNEIARLEGENQLLLEQLGSLPENRATELKEIEAKTQKQTTELEQLELEISQLEIKKRTLQQDFESYQRQYPIHP
jgi:chromosome segregation ATPase